MSTPLLTEPRRIAIVVTAKITAETFVFEFANYIASEGNEVFVLADGIAASERQIGKGKISNIPIRMERDPHPLRDLRSLITLRLQLKKLEPHIITYATPKASLLSAIAGFTLQIPVRVYQLWGLRLETTKGTSQKVLSIMEIITSCLSTAILANSKSLAIKYREMGLNSGKLISVLGQGSSHGVDTNYFNKTVANHLEHPPELLDIAQSPSDLVVGFVGRIHPDKGIDTLFDAVGRASENGYRIKMIVVGADEGAEITVSENMENNLIRVGHVVDTRPYYSRMDVLVLPSLREGFPNVVLEAASMSIPAIVSNGTGVIDSVIDKHTGLIVPIGDAKKLAEAIGFLSDNPEIRKKYGQAARQHVEKHFRKEKVWTDTLEFLIEQARPSRGNKNKASDIINRFKKIGKEPK